MNELEHERLDVDKAAIELLMVADAVAATLPAYIADQRRRASSSISFNIAEGVGELAPEEKGSTEWPTLSDRAGSDPRRMSSVVAHR